MVIDEGVDEGRKWRWCREHGVMILIITLTESFFSSRSTGYFYSLVVRVLELHRFASLCIAGQQLKL